MNQFLSLRPSCIVIAALGFLMLPDRASAGERPHSSRGTAQFVSANDFIGEGNATHLGRYEEVGSVSFAPTSNPTLLDLDGWAIYTASNGDDLHAVFTGELNLATGAITATLTYLGGTGRFADAAGSASLAGQLQPGGAISVAVKGTIDY